MICAAIKFSINSLRQNAQKDGAITTTVWAFVMTFLGDMPQEAYNSGFMTQNPRMGCLTCFCPTPTKSPLLTTTMYPCGGTAWTEVTRKNICAYLVIAPWMRKAGRGASPSRRSSVYT